MIQFGPGFGSSPSQAVVVGDISVSATPPHSGPSRALYEVAFSGPTGKAQS